MEIYLKPAKSHQTTQNHCREGPEKDHIVSFPLETAKTELKGAFPSIVSTGFSQRFTFPSIILIRYLQ